MSVIPVCPPRYGDRAVAPGTRSIKSIGYVGNEVFLRCDPRKLSRRRPMGSHVWWEGHARWGGVNKRTSTMRKNQPTSIAAGLNDW